MFWEVFYSVLLLLTGIGVFLVGIIKFSNLLQASGNDKIKDMFRRMGNNRMVGFGVGTAATGVIQSSTATTVIVVSLVNAGIMTLPQSTAVIFGANVGSALSNMLLSLSAFRIKYFFMFLVFIGAMMKIFTTKKRLNAIADVLISFGVIFVGLEVMSMSFRGSDYLTNGFARMLEAVSFPLLLVLFGFLITAIIQSSTATIAIFITLAATNVYDSSGYAVGRLLEFTSIMYLVIGTMLGTTLTTLIASIPSNRNAKRAAVTHLLFNVLAALIFLPIIWPLQHVIAPFFQRIVPNPIWQISVFSLVVKLSTAIILLSFIKPLNKLVFHIVKDIPEQISIDELEEVQCLDSGHASGFSDKF